MSFRLVREVDRIAELTGDELDKEFILVETKVRPLFDTEVALDRNDFRLRSRANNDSSLAQSPERIAGAGVLTLGQTVKGGGGVFGQSRDAPVIGGAPGTGTRPRRLPTPMDSVGSGRTSQTETTIGRGKASEDDGTLAGRLRSIEVPLEASPVAREGYLYFQVSPKTKLKRLALFYDGDYGEFELTFDE